MVNWIKRYRMNRAEMVRYFGESLAVPVQNSAQSVWKLYHR